MRYAVVGFGGINPPQDTHQLQLGVDPCDGRAGANGKPRTARRVFEQCAIFVEPNEVAVVGRNIAGLLHHVHPLGRKYLLSFVMAIAHEHQANEGLVHG